MVLIQENKKAPIISDWCFCFGSSFSAYSVVTVSKDVAQAIDQQHQTS
jgi:phage regulator Rha-like protein